MGKFINRVGEEYKGIRIENELGRDYVSTECMLCGYKEVKRKSLVIQGKSPCRNCKGSGEGLIGKEFRTLKIIEIESDRGFVVCKCMKCGVTDKYRLANLREDTTLCKHCGINKNLKNTVGNIYGNFVVMEELGTVNKVSYITAKCMLCGSINNYRKQPIQLERTVCKKCRRK